jgi:hypothetical protein
MKLNGGWAGLSFKNLKIEKKEENNTTSLR